MRQLIHGFSTNPSKSLSAEAKPCCSRKHLLLLVPRRAHFEILRACRGVLRTLSRRQLPVLSSLAASSGELRELGATTKTAALDLYPLPSAIGGDIESSASFASLSAASDTVSVVRKCGSRDRLWACDVNELRSNGILVAVAGT